MKLKKFARNHGCGSALFAFHFKMIDYEKILLLHQFLLKGKLVMSE